MKGLGGLFTKYRRQIIFAIVGGLNTAADFAVFSLLVWAGLLPWIAQGCGYAAGMINSYFMNKYITFKSRKRSLRQTLLFFAVTGATLGLSMLAVWLLHDVLGLHGLIAKLLVTPVVMVLNYLGYSKIVFKVSAE